MTFLRMLLPVLLAAAAVFGAAAQRRNSIGRGRLRPAAAVSAPSSEPYDTVACRSGMVRFSGYDKALRASRETVFLSNLMSDSTVEAVWFTVTYLDSSARELHRRSVRARVCVPPGATRRLDFPTWDTQRSFYFSGSRPPRTPAIPYTVTLSPDTLLLDMSPAR